MKADIQKYVSDCTVYQRNKSLAISLASFLLLFDIPTRIWEDINVDFVEGLPRSTGYYFILVVVDRLSIYAHLVALQHLFTTKSMTERFIKEVVCLHGYPRSFLLDRDKISFGQIDSQTELVNKCVETYLRCFYSERSKKCFDWLCWEELWYNATYQISIGITPFEAEQRPLMLPLNCNLKNRMKLQMI